MECILPIIPILAFLAFIWWATTPQYAKKKELYEQKTCEKERKTMEETNGKLFTSTLEDGSIEFSIVGFDIKCRIKPSILPSSKRVVLYNANGNNSLIETSVERFKGIFMLMYAVYTHIKLEEVKRKNNSVTALAKVENDGD